ncbi:hypothetical protein [Actinokineospora enzanensis]|uniref:hypothetical protein n=1 Tax=Actinokineospora enzanensis TaxID=155975 RepID=UPI0005260C65|nr:hypothetical protein [Actinokineospora enzanensis]
MSLWLCLLFAITVSTPVVLGLAFDPSRPLRDQVSFRHRRRCRDRNAAASRERTTQRIHEHLVAGRPILALTYDHRQLVELARRYGIPRGRLYRLTRETQVRGLARGLLLLSTWDYRTHDNIPWQVLAVREFEEITIPREEIG